MLVKPQAEADALLTALYTEMRGEVDAMRATVSAHCQAFERKGLPVGDSSSMEDCIVLYLLIRRFKRRHAFEIGTNIGTTAVAMNEAVRQHGGVLTTCDPVDFNALSPWSGIRFVHAPADVALYQLRAEGHTIDFCFLDWKPESETIRLMNQTCPSDTILCVHDYVPGMKGVEIVKKLDAEYHYAAGGTWFLPGPHPVVMSDDLGVNQCTAYFIPTELLAAN